MRKHNEYASKKEMIADTVLIGVGLPVLLGIIVFGFSILRVFMG